MRLEERPPLKTMIISFFNYNYFFSTSWPRFFFAFLLLVWPLYCNFLFVTLTCCWCWKSSFSNFEFSFYSIMSRFSISFSSVKRCCVNKWKYGCSAGGGQGYSVGNFFFSFLLLVLYIVCPLRVYLW